MNALAFSSTNFFFGNLADHGEKESKIHNFTKEKLQKTRDKRNEDRMKGVHFTNNFINHFFKTASKECSKSTHQQCWWSNGWVLFLFLKQKTPFPAPEPIPLYFTTRQMVRKMILIYIISKKLLFVRVVTGLAT